MSDYTKMSPGEMYHEMGVDAHKWADAFLQYNPLSDIDAGTAHTWFCNAIMAGHDAALGGGPLCGDHADWLMKNHGTNVSPVR